MSQPFQVASTDPKLSALVRTINDALRQIGAQFDSSVPTGCVIFWPTGSTLPNGWQLADGTNDQPDLRPHGFGVYVPIVRRG